MVGGSTGLGHDFDTAAAGTAELRGVRVIVDANLGDGGGRHGGRLHLDAVDDDADSAGRDRAGIKERREGTDEILVEDGDRAQVFRLIADGVFVGGGVNGQGLVAVDRDSLDDPLGSQLDDKCLAMQGKTNGPGRRRKAVDGRDLEEIGAYRNGGELEGTG